LIGVRCKEKGTDETRKKRDGTDEQRETYRAFPLPPAAVQRAVTNYCSKGNKGYHREKERENGAHACPLDRRRRRAVASDYVRTL